MDKLTPKQRRFVQEYLLDLNATQAAIRAGYSRKTAGNIGGENVKKPEIEAAIKEAQDERAKRNGVSQDAVIEELKRLAYGDLRNFAVWGPDGVTLFSSDEVDPEAARALQEITSVHETTYTKLGEKVETVNTKVKMADKKAALELLGRHLGMWKDNLNLATDRPFVVRLKGLSDRAEEDQADRADKTDAP